MSTTVTTALAASAALTLAVFATACGSDTDGAAEDVDDEVVVETAHWRLLPGADGAEVPIYIDVGTSGCASLNRVDVDESADTVTITAYANDRPRAACPAVMVEETVVLTLEAPLGDRSLLGCVPADPSADCRG